MAHEQSWQIPYSTRVDSLSNYQHTEAFGDNLEVMDLIEDATALDAAELARLREIALAEPQIAGKLLPPSAAGTAVAVTVHLPRGETGIELELTAFARGLAAAAEARFPGHRVALSGLVPFSGAFEEAGRHDLTTLVPLMYGVLIDLADALPHPNRASDRQHLDGTLCRVDHPAPAPGTDRDVRSVGGDGGANPGGSN